MTEELHIIEQAVKLLCEKSQRPHDDFDIMAQKLGCFGDEYLHQKDISKNYDYDIIKTARAILGNGTLIVETINESVFVKLMELRGTPIVYEKSLRDIEFDYQGHLEHRT